MTPLSSCLALAPATALAAVPDVVPVSCLPLALAPAMAVAISKGCMQQLVPACISLFERIFSLSQYTSGCVSKYASRQAGRHRHWSSHVTDSDLGLC